MKSLTDLIAFHLFLFMLPVGTIAAIAKYPLDAHLGFVWMMCTTMIILNICLLVQNTREYIEYKKEQRQ